MQSSATDPPPLNGPILKDGSGHEAWGAMARKRHKSKLRRVEVLRGQGRTMAPDRRFRTDLLQLGGMSRDRPRQWKDLRTGCARRSRIRRWKPILTATAREGFSTPRPVGPASTTFGTAACNGAQAVPRAGTAPPHAASHPPRPGRRRHRCAGTQLPRPTLPVSTCIKTEYPVPVGLSSVAGTSRSRGVPQHEKAPEADFIQCLRNRPAREGAASDAVSAARRPRLPRP